MLPPIRPLVASAVFSAAMFAAAATALAASASAAPSRAAGSPPSELAIHHSSGASPAMWVFLGLVVIALAGQLVLLATTRRSFSRGTGRQLTSPERS